MQNSYNRRRFITSAGIAAIGLGLTKTAASMYRGISVPNKRIGIIGLDTSHSTAFTKALNTPTPGFDFQGYTVAAAYPHGSKDIKSSVDRIPGYIEEVKKM